MGHAEVQQQDVRIERLDPFQHLAPVAGLAYHLEIILERIGTFDLDEITARLGAWLGGVVSLLDPDIIVLGGGVMQIGEPLFARLRAIVPARTVNPYAAQTPIVPAQFGLEAGVVGGAPVVLGDRAA